ncbi:hypothetical protein IKC_06366 [Bacillus cereus VD184]|uniref:Uncharacterized protein n=1 Tax=Bacillus cereus VD184 TaxID=1053242 RepID=A0A9W5VVJ3_BACCE|nr:hypothetical protein IKC_06366 [Bacillus cereus VD184]
MTNKEVMVRKVSDLTNVNKEVMNICNYSATICWEL